MFGRFAQLVGALVRFLHIAHPARWIFDWTIYRPYLAYLRFRIKNDLSRARDSGQLASQKEVKELLSLISPTSSMLDPIRVGPLSDGGYVVPKEIFEVKALFSPGVAQSSDFELEFASRGIPCFLADASVERPPVQHPNFRFLKRFIGAKSDGDLISMPDWINASGAGSSNFALQMDIEGSEWDVLQVSGWLSSFRFIVIELHDLEKVWFRTEAPRLLSALRNLSRDFECVLTVGNNFGPLVEFGDLSFPKTVEVTYVRRGDISIGNSIKTDDLAGIIAKNNPRLPSVEFKPMLG